MFPECAGCNLQQGRRACACVLSCQCLQHDPCRSSESSPECQAHTTDQCSQSRLNEMRYLCVSNCTPTIDSTHHRINGLPRGVAVRSGRRLCTYEEPVRRSEARPRKSGQILFPGPDRSSQGPSLTRTMSLGSRITCRVL